ncbi:MAG TPA: Crp/Fnr family transcriptional regulator [Symbiobacteriaceae bacterium]|nr:Crp/Fnr family transcriptional regulator [Symbiobacteriaceae bacterium]
MVQERTPPERCVSCPVRAHGAPFCWRDLQAQLALLGASGVVRRLAPGEILYRQGDQADGWWIVRRGQVLEYMVDLAGREQIIRLAPAGSVCGLCGLGSVAPHWAGARAGRRGADTCYVPREEGRRLAEASPAIVFALLAGMAEEIRFAYHKLHGLCMLPARAAIAYILLSTTECTAEGRSVITLSRSEIASMVGVAVETVVRILNEFRARGLIEDTGHHQIGLCDPCRLHAISEGLDSE